MKIAVTYENGIVFPHFGKCEQFLTVVVEDGKIVGKSILSANGQGHGALAVLLRDADVDVLICGGMGEGALRALNEAGIRAIRGAKGNAEAAVEAYVKGELHDDVNSACHHHDAHHSCGDHDHCHE